MYKFHLSLSSFVCVCVCACVRARACACVCHYRQNEVHHSLYYACVGVAFGHVELAGINVDIAIGLDQ